jgi:hypothetical protein
MPERYIRPPLVAEEPPSAWVAVWRFRVVLIVLVAAVAALVLYLLFGLHRAGEGSPGVGGRSVPAAPASLFET